MPLSLSDIDRAAQGFLANNPMSQEVVVMLNPADFQSIQREYQQSAGAVPGILTHISGFTLRSSDDIQPGTAYIVSPPEPGFGRFPAGLPDNEPIWNPRAQGWTSLVNLPQAELRSLRDTANATSRSLAFPGGSPITLEPPKSKEPPTIWEHLLEDD